MAGTIPTAVLDLTMARRGKRRGSARRGSGWSVTFDGPDIEQLGRELIEEGLRSGVIEAAEEAAAEEGFGDTWQIDVELNVDDGRTVHAVVAKEGDGEPKITDWKAAPGDE